LKKKSRHRNDVTGAPDAAPATERKKKSRARDAASAAAQLVQGGATAQQPPTTGSKRKRHDDATPKPSRRKTISTDATDTQSPDLTKRARLEEHGDSHAHPMPTTPASMARGVSSSSHPAAADGDASTPSVSSSAHELAVLAADIDGSDLTPQGSREARKLQRYIQMIQKMEDRSKGRGAARKASVGEVAQAEDESTKVMHEPTPVEKATPINEEATAENESHLHASAPSTPAAATSTIAATPSAANNAASSAAAAREARAKLRQEKLERLESQQQQQQTTSTDGTADDAADLPAPKPMERKRSKKRKDDEPATLTPAEVRHLRSTATSQLRPLGPFYFGRKQFLLSSYREETLRCETGWASPIHANLPLAKRIVGNWKHDQEDMKSHTRRHSHHHHHDRPPTIFPPSHPWNIKYQPQCKAKRKHEDTMETQTSAAPSTATTPAEVPELEDRVRSESSMDVEMATDADAVTSTMATANGHVKSPPSAAVASSADATTSTPSHVKLEPIPSFSSPMDFYRRIDEIAPSSNIRNVIDDYSGHSVASASIPPKPSQAQPEMDESGGSGTEDGVTKLDSDDAGEVDVEQQSTHDSADVAMEDDGETTQRASSPNSQSDAAAASAAAHDHAVIASTGEAVEESANSADALPSDQSMMVKQEAMADTDIVADSVKQEPPEAADQVPVSESKESSDQQQNHRTSMISSSLSPSSSPSRTLTTQPSSDSNHVGTKQEAVSRSDGDSEAVSLSESKTDSQSEERSLGNASSDAKPLRPDDDTAQPMDTTVQ